MQNAYKAMPNEGTVTIQGRRRGAWAEVRVRDTGEGVPPGVRNKLLKGLIPKERDSKGMGIGGLLVAILVAVGMFRASGGIDLIVRWLGPVTGWIGMPAEALPMALLRPLTGSGALGVMVEAMSAHGPDSRIGYMVSTFQGSTETTFYVLAVYFGAIGVKKSRHTLPACLLADTPIPWPKWIRAVVMGK